MTGTLAADYIIVVVEARRWKARAGDKCHGCWVVRH